MILNEINYNNVYEVKKASNQILKSIANILLNDFEDYRLSSMLLNKLLNNKLVDFRLLFLLEKKDFTILKKVLTLYSNLRFIIYITDDKFKGGGKLVIDDGGLPIKIVAYLPLSVLKNFFVNIYDNKITIDNIFHFLKREVMATINHELQHLIDIYISKYKLFLTKRSNKYYNSNYHTTELNNDETLKKYFNLEHEINAHITQGISNIRPYEYVDFFIDGEKIVNLYQTSYFKVFFNKFINFNRAFYYSLTPKNKKYVIKKVAKLYYAILENFDKEEINTKDFQNKLFSLKQNFKGK
jgi:hypothetical protein